MYNYNNITKQNNNSPMKSHDKYILRIISRGNAADIQFTHIYSARIMYIKPWSKCTVLDCQPGNSQWFRLTVSICRGPPTIFQIEMKMVCNKWYANGQLFVDHYDY